jgi:hypothetical protein
VATECFLIIFIKHHDATSTQLKFPHEQRPQVAPSSECSINAMNDFKREHTTFASFVFSNWPMMS